MSDYTIRNIGDEAFLVEFENEISLEVNRKVTALKSALDGRKLRGVGETVPSYRSLLVHYDPAEAGLDSVLAAVGECAGGAGCASEAEAVVTEIPVLYEGEYAPDLEEIARLEGKSAEEVIRIHSGSDYYVYMLGFAPGHPYTARFENPFSFRRRDTPRVKIPGGSVVVQLALSDIIPFEQPCGWNIIGTTPVLACDYRRANPFLLKAGQWIRHVPISRDEFADIKRRVELGCYQCRTYRKGL